MTTIEKLAAAQELLADVPHPQLSVYCNVQAIRNLLKEKQDALMGEIIQHPRPNVLNVADSTSYPNSLLTLGVTEAFVRTRIALDLFESTAEWLEAEAIIQPQLDSIAELEAELAAENEVRAGKQAALNLAKEQALAKAQAAALEDPAVRAAQAALEALEAPATAPRKGKLGTVAEVS